MSFSNISGDSNFKPFKYLYQITQERIFCHSFSLLIKFQNQTLRKVPGYRHFMARKKAQIRCANTWGLFGLLECNSPKEMTFYFWVIEECCMNHKWQEGCVCSGRYLVGVGLVFGMPWLCIQGEFGPKLYGSVSSFRLGPRQEQPYFLLFHVIELMYPSSKSA